MRFLKSIKFRLMGWYLVVMVVLLLIFGTLVYFMLSNNLYQNLDDSLKTVATDLHGSLEGGSISLEGRLGDLIYIHKLNGYTINIFSPDAVSTDIDRLAELAILGQKSFLTVITADGQETRFYAAPFGSESDARTIIVVGRSTAEIKDVLGNFIRNLGIIAAALVFLATIGGWFLANRALKPVVYITRTAKEIGEHDLSRRINVTSDDELGELSSTLNRMIERLEAAFGRQRQFTADASHELRTPLAIIQAEATLALNKDRTLSEYQKSLEMIAQTASNTSSLIEKLLFLARYDIGKEAFHFDEINLKELLNDLSSDTQVIASEKGLNVDLNPLEDLFVRGDRGRLKQLFLNILINAVTYTPAGGHISVSVLSGKGMATVGIKDTGIGIPMEHLPFIFERFYRVDKSRSRAEGGAGLGLAIAKQIAESYGGTIEVESQVGKGSTFHVTLPLCNPIQNNGEHSHVNSHE